MERAPDPILPEFAWARKLILVSHDVNTMTAAVTERLKNGLHVSGVIFVKQRAPILPVIEDIQLIWTSTEAEEWMDLVQFLPV